MIMIRKQIVRLTITTVISLNRAAEIAVAFKEYFYTPALPCFSSFVLSQSQCFVECFSNAHQEITNVSQKTKRTKPTLKKALPSHLCHWNDVEFHKFDAAPCN